ncbi:unnamed protein product [Rhodiola kirilowii]
MALVSLRRRRLHHGDVSGHLDSSSPFDGTDQPLLANDQGSVHDDARDDDYDQRKKEELHWSVLLSNVIYQWAQLSVFESGSLLGRIFSRASTIQYRLERNAIPPLSALQEARLQALRRRLEVPFDGSLSEHQDALRELWTLAFPDRDLPGLKSESWKDMGWQGSDPSTDFRGGGFISLENLIFFARKYPDPFQRLLHKQDGKRAEWEYPFAVAGINISFMLAQMLDLKSGIPRTVAGIHFLEMLTEDEMAFDHLYCIAFQMMDAQWLAKRASYMQFNEVLKDTRTQLERELALEDISNVTELPAYNLLRY